ncbi:MAG: LacI family DNA-binding transcriptional regulator [Chitinophagaceae bacterium]|nr:LacI family DNA-binding transcriptional regulator [Chitinophagaceae bacterium]
MGNTTIKVLAKQLNLSVATISKALRDSHEISAETKQKVLGLAKHLNYVPNPYASSLRKRRSKTIAVVLPEVADSFFSLAINGIEAVAQEKGYHVLIYLTHESFAKEEAILRDFQGGRVDGILISVSGETGEGSHIKDVIAAGVPVVFFDRICEDVETAKITTDDFESGYNATRHLAEQGCKKIAYLSVSPALSISSKRLEGYKKALAEIGIRPEKKDIVSCTNDAGDNYRTIKKLLQSKNRPDGLIASVEKLTTTVYMVCSDLRLEIPGMIKIISFTNLPTAAVLNPSLTTITQPAFEMGREAAGVLFKTLDRKNFNLKKASIVIPSSLVVRKSTA